VPQPLLRNGTVVPATAATGAPVAGAVEVVGFTDRVRAATGLATKTPRVWCTDCAPAVPSPLPPAPDGVAPGTVVAGGCAGGSCAAGHSGDCWAKMKNWFCFRYTPVHLGCHPTPRQTPLYTYFPCVEGSSCAAGNCGPGGCAAPGHRLLGGKACTTCPQPGEPVMPGFRLAAPTAGTPAAPAGVPAADVVQSGFRVPGSGQPAIPARPQTGGAVAPR
jgi:hypothetical protein